ncbi:NAD(P)-bd-dom domain-containing protein [Fusarium keratoplasticum]|uniref:NAD(P)-bd-dom domain-containing protein n=1 Tax=Fusarium keratoplasticum TaxID=1328300 RepID=A0ACC0R9S1_9HYPO|nr:NAD(P)-bd-dom domain-containing protein [Fusarium keratoplasticum]KAI8679261.1 NAD(P)-bd-dom domain-containing protein [Fusarium keratoplasticum]
MKLVVAGATGFLGTEVVRQALSHPKITSVIALARRQTAIPEGSGSQADASKLKSVACDDFISYPESVKTEIADADACIWLIAVTPTKSKTFPQDEVRKICHDYPLAAVDAFSNLPRKDKTEPFRFVYVSGSNAERDPAKKPWVMGDYCVMRGQVEADVLERAQKSNGALKACVFKPGLINTANTSLLVKGVQGVARVLIGLPTIQRDEMAAALLDKAINGFEKDTFMNEELIEIGQGALKTEAPSQ